MARRKALLHRIRTLSRVAALFTVVGRLLAGLGLAGLVLAAAPPEGWLERAREAVTGLEAALPEGWRERAREGLAEFQAAPPEGWRERAREAMAGLEAALPEGWLVRDRGMAAERLTTPPEDTSVAESVDPATASPTDSGDPPAESDLMRPQVAVPPTPASVATTAAPTPIGIGTGTGRGTPEAAAAGTSFASVREAPIPAPTSVLTPPPSHTPTSDGPNLAAARAPSRPITGVVVPRLSLVADVVPARLVEQRGGLTWDVPAFRAGHAEATAGAAELGNAILLGHVTSRQAGNVFKALDKARPGDQVLVFSGEQRFDYRVVEVREVDRTDVSVMAPTETPSLSLITCSGVWLPFVRDYTRRLVVRAELADVAAAIPPSAPASRAPIDAPVLRTVLEERFTDRRRRWPQDPQVAGWFTDGTYRLSARQLGRFVAVGAPLATPLRDVVVTGTFRKVGGPPGGGYGLIVRDQGPGPRDGIDQGGRYYVLEVGDLGELGIWRREEDHWVDILPWTPSDVVRPGGATNVLAAQAAGERLTFLVNGTPVAGVVDSVLAEGAVGIFVGGDVNEVVVDRFVVQVPD